MTQDEWDVLWNEVTDTFSVRLVVRSRTKKSQESSAVSLGTSDATVLLKSTVRKGRSIMHQHTYDFLFAFFNQPEVADILDFDLIDLMDEFLESDFDVYRF